MASFRKRGKSWTAEVWRKGVRQTATFRTKLAAQAWAAELETAIETGRHRTIPDRPFRDLLDRYGREVSAHKRGSRAELHRIAAIGRDPLGDIHLPDLRAEHFVAWRDRRLKVVSGASVSRDWSIISHALKTARIEWGWIDTSPLEGLRRPRSNPPRKRVATPAELERMMIALGYDDETAPVTVGQRVGAAFLFAIETGMREGEIGKLLADHVDLDAAVASLPASICKNGDARQVPLSKRAIDILKHVRTVTKPDLRWFGMNPTSICPLWTRARDRAMVDGLNFHDSRHMAITQLSQKLDVLSLARMVGHKDIRQLMTYYNPDAADLAKRLG